MKDRLSEDPGRVLVIPEDGSAPFYAIITRADNPKQEGDALNKANLLKDQTAARYGKGNNAVPDDILAQIATELDRYSFAQAGGLKMDYGSYVGDGKHGSATPNTLSFDFQPKFVLIVRDGSPIIGGAFFEGSSTYSLIGWTDGTLWMDFYATLENKTLSWYCLESSDQPYGAPGQLNTDGTTYYYVAFGFGDSGLDFDRLDYLELLGDEESTETTEEEADA